MDVEQALRAHLVERADRPIPGDLATRIASRIEVRRPRAWWLTGRAAAVAVTGLAAVLVVAILVRPTGPAPAASSPMAGTAAPPTAEPTPSPSPSPTPSPSPSSALLGHPSGAGDVLLSLRIESEGGIPTSDSLRALRQETVFVLYGDGTVVFDAPIIRRGGNPTPEDLGLYTVHLDDRQVDQVLRRALDEGRLRDAFRSYPLAIVPRTDAVVSIDADGVTKGLFVTAPGADDPSLGASDRSIRTALRALVDYLTAFGGSSIVRDIGRTAPYRADRYLAVLDDGRSITLAEPFPSRLVLSPWPWPDVLPVAFHTGTTSARTLVITPGQYDALLALPTAYGQGFAVRGPDGHAYLISARPLLPGERLP